MIIQKIQHDTVQRLVVLKSGVRLPQLASAAAATSAPERQVEDSPETSQRIVGGPREGYRCQHGMTGHLRVASRRVDQSHAASAIHLPKRARTTSWMPRPRSSRGLITKRWLAHNQIHHHKVRMSVSLTPASFCRGDSSTIRDTAHCGNRSTWCGAHFLAWVISC